MAVNLRSKFVQPTLFNLMYVTHCNHLSLTLSNSTNERYKNVSRAISVLSVEYPSRRVAEQWWNPKTNGALVIQKRAKIEQKGKGVIRWSDKIELDVGKTTLLLTTDDTCASFPIPHFFLSSCSWYSWGN